MKRGLDAFQRLLANDPMAVVIPLAVFAATFLAAWLVRNVLMRALRAWNQRVGTRAGSILYDALRGPTRIWVLILALHMAIESSELTPKATSITANVLLVLWILSLTVMSAKVVGDLVRFYGGQIPGAMPVTTLTQSLAQISVFLLAALIVLNHFDVSITPILTALGVGGLAVALALQDTLSNLFGGFYVAVAGQVRLGDYIKLNTGEEGYVADIGWRSTTLRALAHNLIIVPNAKLAQAIVTNYHLPDKRIGASFQLTIGYDQDSDAIEKMLQEVLDQASHEVPGMLADPAPSVAFDPGFGDNGYTLTLNFQAVEFADQFRVRNELRRRVMRRLKAEGIGVPYASRTVFLRGSGRKRGEPAES